MSIALADSFMGIFGFKRIARQQRDVVIPMEFELEQCDICGDFHEGDIPRECETGDSI